MVTIEKKIVIFFSSGRTKLSWFGHARADGSLESLAIMNYEVRSSKRNQIVLSEELQSPRDGFARSTDHFGHLFVRKKVLQMNAVNLTVPICMSVAVAVAISVSVSIGMADIIAFSVLAPTKE